jgi:large subunit ribosomal protein L24
MDITVKSSKPSKQRKRLTQAPKHRRGKLFSAPLSFDLAVKQDRKSVPLRKGDKVKVMRGDYKEMEGKIHSVNRKEYKITVEGVTKEKADGSTYFVPIHPSNVMITKLDTGDKWRSQRLQIKQTEAETGEKLEEEEEKEGEESG